MADIQKAELQSRIQAELLGNILPWWMAHTVDLENGGFYGAVTNDLRVLNDVPRSLVLCARILWSFSAAYRAYQDPAYLKMAQHAYAYLTTRFWDTEYGGCYWMIDRQGQPVDDRKQSYGQGFAIYGLTEFALALRGDGKFEDAQTALEWAKAIFHFLEEHACDPIHGGYVEACSRSWGVAGDLRLSEKEPNVQKSMNTMLHVMEPYTNLLRAWDAAEPRLALEKALRAFLDHIIDPVSHTSRLFFDMDWTPIGDHVSFGHDIEATWLLVEAAEALGDEELVARSKKVALEMAQAAEKGLDSDGALLYEADPHGFVVIDKDWWPQAEGMVGFYHAAQISPDPRMAKHFTQISFHLWKYIEDKFVDRQNGDWFKKLSRSGEPVNSGYKAGPWDCPYHHVRACLEMIRRLSA